MTDNRLTGADFVRALACMVVVGHHLSQRMSWDRSLGWMEWMRFFGQVGGFGVAIFFVLSGFLLAQPFWLALDADQPVPSLRTYALRRAARILPGFWLALTVTLILSIWVFSTPLTAQLVGRYLAGLLLVADWHWVTFFPVEINGPLWSISFEVTSYLMLPFGFLLVFAIAPLAGRGWVARALWIGVIALALGAHLLFTKLVQPDALGRGWDYGLIGGAKFWMPRFNPFAFFAMFAIGALASSLQVVLVKHRSWLFDVASLAGLATVGWVLIQQSYARGTEAFGFLGVPHDYPWLQLAIGFVLAVTPSSVIVGQVLDNPIIRYVARISFGIYVWHYVVLELIRISWAPDIDHGKMADPVRMAIVSGAILFVTFVAAHLSFYLLEQPVIRWARGLERRPAANAPTLSPAAG